jgi:hypothetical protein
MKQATVATFSWLILAMLAACAGTTRIADVTVQIDKNRYAPGGVIIVTIRNGLDTEIQAPPERGSGPVVDIQHLEAGQWVTLKPTCPASFLSAMSLAAQSKVSGVVGPCPARAATPTVVAGSPAIPSQFGGNLGGLPTAVPWQTGTPVHEVPPGILPSETPTTPLTLLSLNLQPGTYRILFTFVVTSDPTHLYAVYSEEFTVAG